MAGIATQVHHERLLHNLNEQNKKDQTSEALPPTPPEQHHHISSETRHKVPLAGWLGANEEDPALKVRSLHFQNSDVLTKTDAGLSSAPQRSSS